MRALHFCGARELAAAVRRREITSRELLERFLARIAERDPELNAVVTLDPERARARADAADRAVARGEPLGPLHGLPITVKDTFETAGVRTTAGFPPLASHVPQRDAVAVERLVRAGAIVFGKTNTPLLASDWQCFNPIFGVTRNPWRRDRTPGGSSGGSAVSVAMGFSAFELGSDIGGSIRVPAHWCGVYGHKPTHGLIPFRGHIPGPPGTLSEPDLAVAGPIARDAEDLDLLLGVLAGPLADRGRAWRLELPEPRAVRLEEFRIAAWFDSPDFPVDSEVGRLLSEAIERIGGRGGRVESRARPNVALPEVLEVYLRLVWPVIVAGLPRESFERLVREAEALSPDAGDWAARLARFGTARHREWLSANERRERLRAAMGEFFGDYDVLLLPVNQVAAIPHDPSEPQLVRRIRVNGEERHYFELFAWIALASAALLPATVAPIGRTRDGLPVGIQIVGPYLEDRTPIAFAKALEEATGGFEPPPAAS